MSFEQSAITYRLRVEVLIEARLAVGVRANSGDTLVEQVETEGTGQFPGRLLLRASTGFAVVGEVFVFAHFGVEVFELPEGGQGAIGLRVKLFGTRTPAAAAATTR